MSQGTLERCGRGSAARFVSRLGAGLLTLALLAPGSAAFASPSSPQEGASAAQVTKPAAGETTAQPAAQDGPTAGAEATATPTPEATASPQATATPAPVATPAPEAAAATEAAATPARVGVEAAEQLPLSLNDAIALALQNNNNIEASTLDVKSAEFDLTAARGAYDPVVNAQSYYESTTIPTASILSGGSGGSLTQRGVAGAASLSGNVPFQGGSYSLDFDSSSATTSNSFTSLNPQYSTSLSLTYNQPLLRGRGIDNNRRQIEVARKNLSITDAQFRAQVTDVIAQVQSSYWNLVYALRNLQVQSDAVGQARAQVESNRRQVEAGVLAQVDVVSAEAQVATYEQAVYAAQESVTAAENTLKTLMLADRRDAAWQRALNPTTPVQLEVPRVQLEVAVESAISARPELQQLQASAEVNEINTRFYRDQTKPQVDLFATVGSTGLAGTAVGSANPITGGTSTVPANLVGGYGTSLSNLVSGSYPSVRVGVSVQLPLRNRTAAANLGRSLNESARIRSQRDQQEQVIESEVRNSMQAMRSAEARVKSATAARAAAETQYQSERRKFQAGASTVFLVLERQQQLVSAQGSEVAAQTDLSRAVAAFERATGNTLGANNVTVREGAGVPRAEIQGTNDKGGR